MSLIHYFLGSRIEVVTNLEAPVLVPHAAATGTSAGHKGETKFSYEVLFRSQHFALSDNACREYLFLCEFFHVESTPALELFQEIMGKTCNIYIVFSLEIFLIYNFSLSIIFFLEIRRRICKHVLRFLGLISLHTNGATASISLP